MPGKQYDIREQLFGRELHDHPFFAKMANRGSSQCFRLITQNALAQLLWSKHRHIPAEGRVLEASQNREGTKVFLSPPKVQTNPKTVISIMLKKQNKNAKQPGQKYK